MNTTHPLGLAQPRNLTMLSPTFSCPAHCSSPTSFPSRSRTARRLAWAWLAGTVSACAVSIPVPNASFELQPAPSGPPFVNLFIDSWQKAPEPAYFNAAIGTPFGIPWFGTTGVFLDSNPYNNRTGSQAAYLLGFPQVSLSQDFNSSPNHEFDARYEVGLSYTLTVGVFGKGTLAPGSTLALRLYYLSDQNEPITVNSTTVTYSSEAFPVTPPNPLNLVDYSVTVGPVTASDPWAGKYIGIRLEATNPIELSTGGNWDVDNVRLEAIPEPGVVALGALGSIALMFAGWNRSRRGL